MSGAASRARPGRVALIGLGANLGRRRRTLQRALALLACPAMELERVSSVYESAPVGPVPDQPSFLNAVVRVRTPLEPRALLRRCLEVEQALGRRRDGPPKGPRTIDLDLLLMDELIVDRPELTLPHPELVRRAFALVPLAEVAPLAVDPRDGSLLCCRVAGLLRRQRLLRLGPLVQVGDALPLPWSAGSPAAAARAAG